MWTTLMSVAALLTLSITIQTPAAFKTALRGNWSGVLEYRDYRNDRRVTLPTMLTVAELPGGILEYAYQYDDGPGKTVRSRDRITIAADGTTYRVQNEDGTYDATFAAEGIASYGVTSTPVVLTGSGQENNAPVDLRITVVLSESELTMRRESRRGGEDWRFRNEYRLQKRAAAGRS